MIFDGSFVVFSYHITNHHDQTDFFLILGSDEYKAKRWFIKEIEFSFD